MILTFPGTSYRSSKNIRLVSSKQKQLFLCHSELWGHRLVLSYVPKESSYLLCFPCVPSTQIQVVSATNQPLARASCGTEGFRNAKKGTGIAAQTAGIAAAAVSVCSFWLPVWCAPLYTWLITVMRKSPWTSHSEAVGYLPALVWYPNIRSGLKRSVWKACSLIFLLASAKGKHLLVHSRRRKNQRLKAYQSLLKVKTSEVGLRLVMIVYLRRGSVVNTPVECELLQTFLEGNWQCAATAYLLSIYYMPDTVHSLS